MEAAIADLAADSGALLNVMGVAMPAGRYKMLKFRFASGVLVLRSDDDTDELIAEVGRPGRSAVVIADSWVGGTTRRRIASGLPLQRHEVSVGMKMSFILAEHHAPMPRSRSTRATTQAITRRSERIRSGGRAALTKRSTPPSTRSRHLPHSSTSCSARARCDNSVIWR